MYKRFNSYDLPTPSELTERVSALTDRAFNGVSTSEDEASFLVFATGLAERMAPYTDRFHGEIIGLLLVRRMYNALGAPGQFKYLDRVLFGYFLWLEEGGVEDVQPIPITHLLN